MLSFKVQAYSFDTLVKEPLACENVQMQIFYNVPTVKEKTRIPVEFDCLETN